jgi:hypothetical protein
MKPIEVEHLFGVELSDAFSFITDIENWPEYWPGLVRVEDPTNARWSEPGDKLTVVLEILRRERLMHMELERFRADALVVYRTRQEGLPDARHERHFNAVPGGVRYRMVVAYEPRPGLRGLFDRLVVERGVERALRKTAGNLEASFERHGMAG